ncbi:MAG TPA: hypothetical protein VJN43_05940 [Bryobacteraceae bacterium]|nr:hypothetical protein [Bryobacteraceae bacterium]
MGRSRGTLIAAIFTTQAAYMAADSRGTSPKSDGEQKLFKCGNVAFIGLAGTLINRATVWSNDQKDMLCQGEFRTNAVVAEFAREYPGDASNAPNNLSRKIEELLNPYWKCFIEPCGQCYVRSNPSGIFCSIPILSWINGSPNLSELRFEHSMITAKLSQPVLKHYQIEVPDGFQKIQQWGGTVNTNGIDLSGDSEERVLQVIESLYDRAISVDPETIGGPVDIGRIDGNGLCWIRYKRI